MKHADIHRRMKHVALALESATYVREKRADRLTKLPFSDIVRTSLAERTLMRRKRKDVICVRMRMEQSAFSASRVTT